MLSWLVSTSVRLRVVLLAAVRRAARRRLSVAPPTRRSTSSPSSPRRSSRSRPKRPACRREQVESLVTVPLENALNGIPDVKTVRSKSVLGLSQVVLILEHGTDHAAGPAARAGARRRRGARSCPTVAQPPVILQPLSSTSRVLKIGVWSKTLSQQDLTDPGPVDDPAEADVGARRGQRRHLGPARQAVPGARRSRPAAGQRRHARRGRAGGRRRGRRWRPAASSTRRTSGWPSATSRRSSSRTTWRATVVDFRGGAPIRLGDVADVVDRLAAADRRRGHQRRPRPAADRREAAGGQHARSDARGRSRPWKTLQPGLQDVEIDPTIFRPATFIERALDNLTHALVDRLRAGGRHPGRVPVRLADGAHQPDGDPAVAGRGGAGAAPGAGATINTMVLAGLVIALGEVVDDAIIDVENIVRRLRLNRAAGNPQSAFQVVLDASLEVRSAVVYASLIVVLVFLPVFFLDGLAGAFFRPLALAYVLAILASLVVALTVTPALSYMLLTGRAAERPEAPLTRLLEAAVPAAAAVARRAARSWRWSSLLVGVRR